MSNPTSNFGWQMPTATDLVTDLPADFEVFGQAVDTSMADLKGGTTGQILAKNTNADMDFVWVANDQGDITGVTAGTGITGGGTSGTVTVTNDMATTITAAGDIVVGTGSGTYDNLPIGTTNQILTADTTVSPYKVKWATPTSSGANYQLLSTTTMSGASTITISGISGINSLFIRIGGNNLVKNATANATFQLRLNGDSGSNYYWAGLVVSGGSTATIDSTTVDTNFYLGGFGPTANSSYVISSIQIDGTGTAGIKPITATTAASGAASSQSVVMLGSYNGTSAITSVSLVSNGSFSGTGQVFVYGA